MSARRLAPETVSAMRRFVEETPLSYGEIGRRCRVSAATVWRYATEAGLDPALAGAPEQASRLAARRRASALRDRRSRPAAGRRALARGAARRRDRGSLGSYRGAGPGMA